MGSDTHDALTLASGRLGASPFVPAHGDVATRVLEFHWNSGGATWVADARGHLLSLRSPTPVLAGFGDWAGRGVPYLGDFHGTRVYRLKGGRAVKQWLDSKLARTWLDGLHLGPGETVAFLGVGVLVELVAKDPITDADRVLDLLDTLQSVVGRAEGEALPLPVLPVVLDPVLEQALLRFGHLCLGDDVWRSEAIAAASESDLIALEQSMTPHLADLDATLDRLERQPYLDVETAGIVAGLHDLGQATIEARRELARRASGGH